MDIFFQEKTDKNKFTPIQSDTKNGFMEYTVRTASQIYPDKIRVVNGAVIFCICFLTKFSGKSITEEPVPKTTITQSKSTTRTIAHNFVTTPTEFEVNHFHVLFSRAGNEWLIVPKNGKVFIGLPGRNREELLPGRCLFFKIFGLQKNSTC
jgi:hypothetical protein